MKERIKNLLINGMKVTDVASVVGCTPSYVSQLLGNEEFKKSIEEGRLELVASSTEEDHIDNRYNNLEHKLLSALEGSLAEATTGEITRALEVVNKRADSRFSRKNPVAPSPLTQVNVVSLHLPAHALDVYTPAVSLNNNQEIIAIDGKPLAPMSSNGVKSLFAQLAEQRDIENANVKMLTVEDI